MKEGFFGLENIPIKIDKEKYTHHEIEEDFLAMASELKRRKQINFNQSSVESHGYRGRDYDNRKSWSNDAQTYKKNVIRDRKLYDKQRIVNKIEISAQEKTTDMTTIESSSLLDGFLKLLREKGIKISTPEWLQFISVVSEKASIRELADLTENNELLNKFRLYAKTTLVKNKNDERVFHEAFNEYFEIFSKVLEYGLDKAITEEEDFKKIRGDNFDKDALLKKEEKQITDELKEHLNKEGVEPEIKEQLGIKEVIENLDQSDDENHEDDENVHGGKKDQHDDILKKEDLSKKGGGNKKEESNGVTPIKERSEMTERGYLIGGGKGKSIFAERVNQDGIIYDGEKIDKQAIQEREKRVGKIDKRMRYEERPDKASMREVIRNIRRIILDVSEVKSKNVNLRGTVANFARRDFRFDYEREREKQPEMVLLIDVGGPVDEWSPLVKEVAEAMADGLTKLEIYLFHNNLYGYVWKPDPKNLLASSYAKPNSLINIKSIVKKRKKVIVYGDAEMSYSEFEGDGWPPRGNDERVEKFGMGGEECLNFIKKKSDSVVWISPVFRKDWIDRDDSGTINAVSEIIPMHDLTVGGVEDAIKELMKK